MQCDRKLIGDSVLQGSENTDRELTCPQIVCGSLHNISRFLPITMRILWSQERREREKKQSPQKGAFALSRGFPESKIGAVLSQVLGGLYSIHGKSASV